MCFLLLVLNPVAAFIKWQNMTLDWLLDVKRPLLPDVSDSCRRDDFVIP